MMMNMIALALAWGHSAKQRFASWLLRGVHLQGIQFGENSITMSPAGVGDVARWSGTQAALALGDLGMNVTTGRPSYYDGSGAVNLTGDHGELSGLSDDDHTIYSLADGSRAFTGQVDGVTPTTAAALATKGYVDGVVTSLQNPSPVSTGSDSAGYLGTASIAEIDAAGPLFTGDSVVAEDAGTPAAGSSDLLAAGDIAEYNGTEWKKMVANSGGFPPDGTAALVASSGTGFITGGGLTSSSDETKRAEWDGTSLTPTLVTPLDGDTVIVKGGDSGNVSNSENKLFIYDGVLVSGSGAVWILIGGVTGLAHSGLSGLTADDHTIYLLLAGRSGGQAIVGGTAAGENLTLESTSNATKGKVQIVSGTDMEMLGDDDFLPSTTEEGRIGHRDGPNVIWKEIHGKTVVSGDHRFIDEGRGAFWTMFEDTDGMYLLNEVTGAQFKVSMQQLSTPKAYMVGAHGSTVPGE